MATPMQATNQASEIDFRLAHPDEREILSEIKIAAAKMYHPDYVSPPIRPETFAEAHAADNIMVAAENSRPLGYALSLIRGNDLYLLHLFVDPRSSGRGIGRHLIEQVALKAEDHGLGAITLVTSGSAPWNAPFYEKCNFRQISLDSAPPYLQDGVEEERVKFEMMQEVGRLLLPRIAMKREIRNLPEIDHDENIVGL